MKLVIAQEHVEQIVMVVGRVEIPLTREQTMQMLFGDEYTLVPTGASAAVKRAPRVAPAKRPLLLPAGPASKPTRSTACPEAVKALLATTARPMGVAEIRAGLPKALRDDMANRNKNYLVGTLARLSENKEITRKGEKGAFVYSAGKGSSASTKRSSSKKSSLMEARAKTASALPEGMRFTDLVLSTLKRLKNPASCDEIKSALERKVPGVMDGRHHSVVASTMLAFGNYGYVKRTGAVGEYKYALVSNWEKAVEKRQAKTSAARVASGKQLAKATKKSSIIEKAPKSERPTASHVNGSANGSSLAEASL